MTLSCENFPIELRELRQWVFWRLEPDPEGGKDRKIPYSPDYPSQRAKAGVPETWGNFAQAVCACETEFGSGIGFEFHDTDPYCGVDLDDCRNPETGEIENWAEQIINKFDTYTEISPSGTGVHLICKARISSGRKTSKDPVVEIYSQARYFCVTGDQLPATFPEVAERQAEIDWLLAEYFPVFSMIAVKRDISPAKADVIERARKYASKLQEAVAGQDGHGKAYRAAMVLIQDFGLSIDQARPLMHEFSERCAPPWSNQEIEHKLRQADKNANPALRGNKLRENNRPAPAASNPAPKTVVPIEIPPPTIDRAASLKTRLDLIKSGQIKCIDFPWMILSRLSRALMPGTLTLICGEGGSSKSLFMRQAINHWVLSGDRVANFELEEDADFHLNRSLSQLSGISDVTDDKWCRENPDTVDELFFRYESQLKSIGAVMQDAPNEVVNLAQLTEWVNEHAKAGARLIAIDPITAAEAEEKHFEAEKIFILNVRTILRRYGASLIVVTHPRGGSSQKGPSLDDMAGGRAWPRFAQNVFWMTIPKDEKPRLIKGVHEHFEVEANRTIKILKARNARGHGCEIAFTFDGSTLRFEEHGLCVKKKVLGGFA